MKRLLVALLLCGALLNNYSLTAQSSRTTPSRFTISTGIGLLPTYFKTNERSGLVPLSFRLGIDVSKNFTLGSYFGYSSTKAKPNNFSENLNTYVVNKTSVFGLQAIIKKDFTDRVQGYGGSMLGYCYANVKEYHSDTKALVVRATDEPTPFNPNEKKGKFTYSAFMGASVKFTKNVSLFGELGYGISLLNLGVTVRI